MVFSSLLFIFLFLALNLLVYWLVDKKYRNHVLLGFSLVFYAWGGPEFLLLLIGDTFVCWLFALLIDRAQTPHEDCGRFGKNRLTRTQKACCAPQKAG